VNFPKNRAWRRRGIRNSNPRVTMHSTFRHSESGLTMGMPRREYYYARKLPAPKLILATEGKLHLVGTKTGTATDCPVLLALRRNSETLAGV